MFQIPGSSGIKSEISYKRQAWCLEERPLGAGVRAVGSGFGRRLRRGRAERGAAVLSVSVPAVSSGAQKLHGVCKADFSRRSWCELCTQAGSSLPARNEVEVAVVLLAQADGVGGAGRRTTQPAAGGCSGPRAFMRLTEMGAAPATRAPVARERARRSHAG